MKSRSKPLSLSEAASNHKWRILERLDKFMANKPDHIELVSLLSTRQPLLVTHNHARDQQQSRDIQFHYTPQNQQVIRFTYKPTDISLFRQQNLHFKLPEGTPLLVFEAILYNPKAIKYKYQFCWIDWCILNRQTFLHDESSAFQVWNELDLFESNPSYQPYLQLSTVPTASQLAEMNEDQLDTVAVPLSMARSSSKMYKQHTRTPKKKKAKRATRASRARRSFAAAPESLRISNEKSAY